MELIKEIEQWVSNLQEKEKKKPYKPRKKTIDDIAKRRVTRFGERMYGLIRELNYNSRVNVNSFFEEITNIKIEKIKNMTEETRKEIMDKIEEKIKEAEFKKDYLTYIEHRMQPLTERVKFITEGKDLTIYYWLTKEEVERIHENVKKINILYMQNVLRLKEQNKEEVALLLTEMSMVQFHCEYPLPFISEGEIKRFVTDEKLQLIKEKLKSWYQDTNQNFVENIIISNHGIYHINNYIYLCNEEQKRNKKEEAMVYIENKYQELKNKKDKDILTKAMMIKREIEILTNW